MLLVASNTFMIVAWYGHLRFKDLSILQKSGLVSIILISWGLAFFEYIFQVPANRIGYQSNGGPFNLFQLKMIQEAINLILFTIFVVVFFKGESLTYNHIIGFGFLMLAVYFIFRN